LNFEPRQSLTLAHEPSPSPQALDVDRLVREALLIIVTATKKQDISVYKILDTLVGPT